MKDKLTLKKQRAMRYTWRIFAGIFAVIPVITLIGLRNLPAALVCGIPFLLILPVLLYCETWKIRFGTKTIEKRVFFWTEQYSYAQILEAVKGYYSSENGWCIRICFADGRCWKIRLNDENGEQAERQLQKHCSIRWST